MAIGDVGPLHNKTVTEILRIQGKQRTTIDIHRHMGESECSAARISGVAVFRLFLILISQI